MPREKTPRPLPAASLHLVLALLDGENHGYALMRRVEELSAGAARMGPGTLSREPVISLRASVSG